MNCPPGTVLNPRTLRCIKASSKTAKNLVRRGNITAVEVQYAQAFGPAQVARRQTQKRAAVPQLQLAPVLQACPPGTQRNPATGKCVKIGGRVFKKLFAAPVAPAAPPAPVVATPVVAAPVRQLTEVPPALPVGTASVAPLGDKTTILAWAAGNCTNAIDPITKESFAATDAIALQQMIRLHNRTCALAPYLHTAVASQHKTGRVATLPDDPTTHMTLDDFKALRDAMRRTNPAYKIPARKHQPPPAEWKLYIASDNRSGVDYVSVLFVDITKARATPTGYEYPVDSVRLDLGFIPVEVAGAICSPTMIIELIQRLTEANRLLMPVAGGWKPVGGFPFTKKYWETERAAKFSRLCRELTKALTTPF